MSNEYWLNRWQDDNIKFNQDAVNPFLQQYFQQLQLAPGSRVLVPLCGKTVDMLWLLQQGYAVIGAELSEIACRDFFEDNQLPYEKVTMEHFVCYQGENISLYAGDFFQLTKDIVGDVHGVYDRAALIALPSEVRVRYAAALSDLLVPNAQMLLLTIGYDQSTMQGPPFSVVQDEIMTLYAEQFEVNLLIAKACEDIPAHLQQKGLSMADDLLFHLVAKA